MTKIGPTHLCLSSLLLAAVAATGQTAQSTAASSVYSPFRIPTVNGNLNYAISASQTVIFGYNDTSATSEATSASGNFGFLSNSVVRPFNFVYAGGLFVDSSNHTYSVFHNVSISQAFNTKTWNFNLSDSLHYLPQAPTVGLSGLPGLGDLGVSTGSTSSQGILTSSNTQITNSASGVAIRNLTGSTSLEAFGSLGLLRFAGSSVGLESNNYSGSGGAYHRIDARTSVSAFYSYSSFSYVGVDGSFASQGISFDFKRQLTRKLSFDASAGPQRIGASSITGSGPSLTYNANVHFGYTGSPASGASLSVGYNRSTNSGSGASFGATTDTINAALGKRLTRNLSANAQFGYARTVALQVLSGVPLTTQSIIGSGQINRALARTLSAYASYTAIRQLSAGNAAGLAPLAGLSQTLGFGLTYSPASLHLGKQ